jgi:hypothetical protein
MDELGSKIERKLPLCLAKYGVNPHPPFHSSPSLVCRFLRRLRGSPKMTTR